ncbi:hypothetical protein [Jannaschia pohangensis]|uniref:Non-specific serine/threonine protein kinase n=1 Tax=Jannaschia pohangensis TaxID=390807 RepID=A0A1I3J3X4_9RHOB|nr:hypothetical protein [Jannaschia pohangensis]SFI54981.1 non-specific serine/threonine protein kinase [Jannaschia pohangensis]
MFAHTLTATALGLALSCLAGAALACPDVSQNGAYGRFTGQQLYEAKFFSVTAGGDFPIRARCKGIYNALRSERGEGFFPVRPDFTLETPGLAGFTLVISVVSDCDSALLINTPAGNWYYDDDDNGNLDARIDLTAPSSGVLDIWVGTADGEYCDAQLRLETF